MNLKWSVVFFPIPEYSVCEDAVVLNVEIHRRGNLNISSYVTVTSVEQTAKEGLDFISRRINKIQFDPGISSIVWKIMIVQDDLEEAPIEQLQVTLSDPENCVLNQNRTVVSIYDLNRGACSQIPVEDPERHDVHLDAHLKNINGNFDSDEIDDDESNKTGFPMACSRNIYGLLHFKQSTQSLYQCDGINWIPWFPNSSSDLETSPSSPYEVEEKVNDFQTTTMLSREDEPSSEPSSELSSNNSNPEYCPKGWQEYGVKCYKWYKQQSTWTEAQNVCESYLSGELVVVESLDHNDWLLKLTRGKSFWIGLHVSLESNEWSYKDTTAIPYQNWKKGFPRLPVNGETKHRCALVRASGLWINKSCDLHDHSYICAIPLKTL